MKIIPKLLLITSALIVAGCMDRSKNDQVLKDIKSLQLVSSPDLAFRFSSGGISWGTGVRIGSVRILGELVSTNGSPLPAGFADEVANTIRMELVKDGCTITGNGTGGGIHYTQASGIQNANIDQADVGYSLNGSHGQAEIFVIERDYQSFDQTNRVVGQLIVRVTEVR